ncbi:Glycerol-3-phosphate dehydrogenase [gamma proteobacterium HdN1]|nr:Glycerol-3-phosphate dehydrogenase [gamma proteobacterium HdN1]
MNAEITSLNPFHTESAPTFDLFVIGGGINGVGIANDATGRGLSVALVEQADLASATSSASSKLIHGGLRYLEQYEFRLVRDALAERETLLAKAPHLIKQMRFILPHRPHLRPAWMIRIGMFLYDHLSTRSRLAGSRTLQLDANDPSNPLEASITTGFEYSDCQVDDARLVVANAIQARDQGALVLTRTRCQRAERKDGFWHIAVEQLDSGQVRHFRARALVNAAGPWAQQFIEENLHARSPRHVRLIKGSHFVVPRIHEGNQAYILQNEDHRIVFVIPYNELFSLVGTTDKEYHGDPREVQIDAEEEQYLLDVVNRHFKHQIESKDILWRYSGVRPLCDDESDSPSAITRDYTLEIETDIHQQLPLLSVFGGKLTTYRKLAESALHMLQPHFPQMEPEWTESTPLPGGNIEHDFEEWLGLLTKRWPWMPNHMLRRMAHAYGTRIQMILGNATKLSDLGCVIEGELSEAELRYLVTEEWAQTEEDLLWRRSKLGLFLSEAGVATLRHLLEEHLPAWKEAINQGPQASAVRLAQRS